MLESRALPAILAACFRDCVGTIAVTSAGFAAKSAGDAARDSGALRFEHGPRALLNLLFFQPFKSVVLTYLAGDRPVASHYPIDPRDFREGVNPRGWACRV